jgi:hypothetical protein
MLMPDLPCVGLLVCTGGGGVLSCTAARFWEVVCAEGLSAAEVEAPFGSADGGLRKVSHVFS